MPSNNITQEFLEQFEAELGLCSAAQKNTIIAELKRALQEYQDSHPDLNQEEIIKLYGDPASLAVSLMAEHGLTKAGLTEAAKEDAYRATHLSADNINVQRYAGSIYVLCLGGLATLLHHSLHQQSVVKVRQSFTEILFQFENLIIVSSVLIAILLIAKRMKLVELKIENDYLIITRRDRTIKVHGSQIQKLTSGGGSLNFPQDCVISVTFKTPTEFGQTVSFAAYSQSWLKKKRVHPALTILQNLASDCQSTANQ